MLRSKTYIFYPATRHCFGSVKFHYSVTAGCYFKFQLTLRRSLCINKDNIEKHNGAIDRNTSVPNTSHKDSDSQSSEARKESLFTRMLRTVYRVGFLPSLSYNVVLNKLNIRPWYNRVDDRVLIGALPWISIKDDLIDQENVRGVVSMNENFELQLLERWVAGRKNWAKNNVKFLQLQTQDIFESPSHDKLLDGVEFIMSFAPGQSVYVHCKAGRTRSATLVCCYLMKQNNWTPEQAHDFLASKRPQLALHSPQWKALRYFYKSNISSE